MKNIFSLTIFCFSVFFILSNAKKNGTSHPGQPTNLLCPFLVPQCSTYLPTQNRDVINGCSPMTQFVQRCTDLDVYFALLLLPAKHKAEQNFLFFWCRDRFCQPRYSLFPILCVLESNKKVNFRSSTMGLSSL